MPWLLLASVSIGLQLTRDTLRNDRISHKLELSQTNLAAKTQELRQTQTLVVAQDSYLQTFKNLSKVKEKSDAQTKAYAATPAGAASCLAAGRVREVLAHRAALEAASTPEGSAGTLPASGTAR